MATSPDSGPATEPLRAVPDLPPASEARAVLDAAREVVRLLTDNPVLDPGLHQVGVDDHGVIVVLYASVAGSSVIDRWAGPDGVDATWRRLLSDVEVDTQFVDQDVTVETDTPAVNVQDKTVTIRGTLRGRPVSVVMTAAGLSGRL